MLLVLLLGTLWVAGGASQADLAGQVVSRAAAWGVVLAAILMGGRPSVPDANPWRPLFIALAAMIALPLVQLIPLPPAIWQAFPGRDAFVQASGLSGQAGLWRPLSLSPGATINAASSLAIPAAVLFLLVGLKDAERAWLPAIVLSLVAASTLVGLVQFSGSAFAQPLTNYDSDVSGTFANRNHFALFLALGCLVVPVWAFARPEQWRWRGPVAIGLLLLFLLTDLASGSRAGMALGVLSLAVGPLLARQHLRRLLAGRSRRILLAIGIAAVAAIALFVIVSVVMGRAVSIDRLLATDVDQDMRIRGLATVMAMIGTYFPVGTGLGSFDPMFRMHEPFALLKPTYFNQAHNDFLGVVLDAGLPGLLMILAVVGWWLRDSILVWRAAEGTQTMLGRLGSAMLLFVLLASAVDYPARTPLMMAIVVIAAAWLRAGAGSARRRGSLPMSVRSI